MEDIFKKFVYTGIGLVAHTAEKVQQTVNRLIDENKISSEEGKKIVDDFKKNSQSKREELEGQFKGLSDKVLKGLNYAKRDELDALKKRVEELERELKKSKKPPVRKKTAKAKP